MRWFLTLVVAVVVLVGVGTGPAAAAQAAPGTVARPAALVLVERLGMDQALGASGGDRP
jgi:hypothetical protein